MGPVERTVTALAQQVGAACQVVVICGRNKRLVQRLEARQYPEGMKVVVTGGQGSPLGEPACKLDTGSLQLAGCLLMQQREDLRMVGLPGVQAGVAPFAVGLCRGKHAPRPRADGGVQVNGVKHAGQAVPGCRPARSLHLLAPGQAASCTTSSFSGACVVADSCLLSGARVAACACAQAASGAQGPDWGPSAFDLCGRASPLAHWLWPCAETLQNTSAQCWAHSPACWACARQLLGQGLDCLLTSFWAAGFVHNMPEWMSASDMIITKAGPGTIAESLICGLPVLLNGFIPCQEEGNVTYVLDNKVSYC